MMKKTVVAVAVCMAVLNGQSMATGLAGPWYTGLKAGWSDYYNSDVSNKVSLYNNLDTKLDMKGDGVAGGAFLGYQANDWLSIEGGYDWLGNAGITSNNSAGAKMENQGIQLTAKLSLPVNEHIDLYARGGMMGWYEEVKSGSHKESDYGVSPLAALGTELAFSEDWAMRLEYQYVANIGQGGDNRIITDNGQTSLAMVYRFGQTQPMLVPIPEPVPVPSTQAPQVFNLQSDVLFAHDSATLTTTGQAAVIQLYQKLHAAGAESLHVTVKGYTDRTGSDAHNQDLSTRRAQAVASVLKNEGLPSGVLNILGMAESDPVTGTQCDSVKNRQALVNCLSPDRRVVVEVAGAALAASADVKNTSQSAISVQPTAVSTHF
ncbi:porin OmpA [Lelliottia sp. V106_10]|uniref:porin OmpA n=1 Tax=Lelliottia wanjuensis TaxID=3050585 RepID=UPI00254A1A3F|nr:MULTISPECIES: porin OmpA [unclassified Lelliottia]MDK9358864.1 porin OmpA [Lelliottia sp. V106_16]MDK9373551.1 porin OmpA [Lelliottia sp. V106_10]MDK9600408.1 porin OmpA [Lelliottia sp. V106_5]